MEAKCQEYLRVLCGEFGPRPVGSANNRLACRFFAQAASSFGWQVDSTAFPALDWEEDGASLEIGEVDFPVRPSPYSRGCDLRAPLAAAGSREELEAIDAAGKILLLHSDLTREQLIPKNYVFFNPEEHQQIIFLLEDKAPAAILAATSRNAALAGGLYPFPLIEDGDFEIPSVYLTEEVGRSILPLAGRMASLLSHARRIPSEGENLVAKRGRDPGKRLAISAHIDTKPGTPGAIDNATGVVVLLLLAELLQEYDGGTTLELLPFNGEDYYAAPGERLYLNQNEGTLNTIQLNINVDGAGYFQGPTACSAFDLPEDLSLTFQRTLQEFPDLVEGSPWVQGDHSIFLQRGIPALAVTSSWFLENIASQELTHTPRDHPGIVDCRRVTEAARFIFGLIQGVEGN